MNDAFVASLQIAAEMDIPVILQRLVHLAREVVPARYAALGVADDDGVITQFITSGISAAVRTAIGPIPQGHGLLGALIEERQPLLVPDIAADPRSVGFPANHPPMQTLIGVPVMLGDVVLGNLYLTDRADGQPFTHGDLAALKVLAAHAATTIERARLLAQAQQARQSAEEHRDHLETILNSLPSAVLLLRNPEGHVELANTAARVLLAKSRGEISSPGLPQPGDHYEILNIDGTRPPRGHWPGRRALSGEVVRNKQLLVRLANGRKVPVLAQAAPLRDSTGAIRRAVVVLQDITQLREAEQLKDDFLSLVSHEMRTPLTAIHGGASLLSMHGDNLDDQTRREILDDIVVESTRLERTLANILTLTGIQAGSVEPAPEPVLLRQFLGGVVAGAGSLISSHRIDLEVPPGTPAAEGDPALLDHVVRNLVENAAKYSPAGTTIRVSTSVSGHQVEIHVDDEGYGIAAEHLPLVFERFRRPGADPSVRGMGLGLYLSRHLVTAQGGTLTVQSAGPGKGARFTVQLPIATGWNMSPEPGQEHVGEINA